MKNITPSISSTMTLVISIFLVGCSSFDLLKGGVQVSKNAHSASYEPYLKNGEVCFKTPDNQRWCYGKDYPFKDYVARIDNPKTNIKASCSPILNLPNNDYKCSFETQVGGPISVSRFPTGATSYRQSYLDPNSVWDNAKCYWLQESGATKPCSEIKLAVANYREKKKLLLEKEQEQKRQALEYQQAKRKAKQQAKRKRCQADTKYLLGNLSEGDYSLQGLVIEVKDKVVMVQSSTGTRWIKKSLILAPSCK